MAKEFYDWAVIEDNGGGLHLYVFELHTGCNAPDAFTFVAAFCWREAVPGSLKEDIQALVLGTNIGEWENGEADPEASWRDWKHADEGTGWRVVFDECGVRDTEHWGAAARKELGFLLEGAQ